MTEDQDDFKVRAQRILVRVLLALRSESKRPPVGSTDAFRDDLRAETLADRIMLDFPHRVLPIGLAAVVLLVVFCSLPLVHDLLPASGMVAQSTPVAAVVESGLKERGADMSEGMNAIREIVLPFASGDAPIEPTRMAPPSEAVAPFKKS